jgi:predicted proteasome-type protease
LCRGDGLLYDASSLVNACWQAVKALHNIILFQAKGHKNIYIIAFGNITSPEVVRSELSNKPVTDKV